MAVAERGDADHFIPSPFPWMGDARRAGGWPKAKESEANLRRCAPPPSRGRRENAAFPASSFRAEARNLFRSRSGKSCEGSGERETPYASCDWGSRCFMQMDLRRKTANGKRKRSLGCARDDETRKRFPPIPFQSRAEANLCPLRGGGWSRETVLPHSGKPTPPRFARLPLPEEGARMIFKETLIKSLSFAVRDSRSPHICRAPLRFPQLSFIP